MAELCTSALKLKISSSIWWKLNLCGRSPGEVLRMTSNGDDRMGEACEQALHLGDIVKSGGARGTREETRKEERRRLGPRRSRVLARLASLAQIVKSGHARGDASALASLFARPNRRFWSQATMGTKISRKNKFACTLFAELHGRDTRASPQIVLKTRKIPYLNLTTQKILAKFFYPPKNPGIKNLNPPKVLRSSPSHEIRSTPRGVDHQFIQVHYYFPELICWAPGAKGGGGRGLRAAGAEGGELGQYLGIGEPLRVWNPDPV